MSTIITITKILLVKLLILLILLIIAELHVYPDSTAATCTVSTLLLGGSWCVLPCKKMFSLGPLRLLLVASGAPEGL